MRGFRFGARPLVQGHRPLLLRVRKRCLCRQPRHFGTFGLSLGLTSRLFRPAPLYFSIARLPCGNDRTAYEAGRDQRSGSNSEPVSAQELAASINQRVLARQHRAAVEVALDVFRQVTRSRVAALLLLVHGHQNDVVQISGEVL
jgi:hypothetical protein